MFEPGINIKFSFEFYPEDRNNTWLDYTKAVWKIEIVTKSQVKIVILPGTLSSDQVATWIVALDERMDEKWPKSILKRGLSPFQRKAELRIALDAVFNKFHFQQIDSVVSIFAGEY